MGLGVAANGACIVRPACLRRRANGTPLPIGRSAAVVARSDKSSLLPTAHHAAHVHRARRVDAVQLRVRRADDQVPRGGEGVGSAT